MPRTFIFGSDRTILIKFSFIKCQEHLFFVSFFLYVPCDTVASLFCLANSMSFESFKCLVTTCGLNYLFTITESFQASYSR